MPDEMPDLRTILAALDAASTRYILIGGLAMVAHGSAHITQDIDISYARDSSNIASIVIALAGMKPSLRGAPADLPFVFDAITLRNLANLTLETSVGEIDLLGDVPGVSSFEDLFQRSILIEIYGFPVHVASLEDLISMKRAANRPKDRLHILELEALRSIIDGE